MPEASARSRDGEALFTAPVLQWLQHHGCRGVFALDDPGDSDAYASPAWATVPVGPHRVPTRGWCFGWRDADGVRRAVLLAFAEPEALPDADRRAVAGYLDLAGRCVGTAPGSAHLLDRTLVSKTIHELRNGLNSLLMNAAVLATKLPPAEREGRFARQVEAEGERCAALLQELSEAIRGPDAPRRE